ncbi:MAG: acyl-CoA dehydrogenase [Candidatus Dadabacteria bacterium]|nr:MAG: acyl-CoA dehydrogenase [Candidatus Dadabacteria bacterium]
MSNFKPDKASSIAKSLFLGSIVEENLYPFPSFSKEEKEILETVGSTLKRFMESKQEVFKEYDIKGEQPAEYIDSLKELGLFGLIISEQYGGIGLSNAGYSRVVEESAFWDASTTLTIGAHSSIGMRGILLFGTEQQKKRYLPKLATGEMIAAFCLTEASAGSDAASIKTEAVKQSDGSWILNGEKIWITNGPIADLYTVFARTQSEKGKLSAFIVERKWEGVTTGEKEDKMGIRASATSSVAFKDVRVPRENLLGEEGKGFKIAMSILNNGRTGLGGGCIGGMKRAISLAAQYAASRKQFKRPIAEFQLIKEKIANMTVKCFATESVVRMVAYYIDNKFEDFAVEAAISKVFSSEALWYSVNEALQIAGGNGYMRDYPYERMVRDSRINLIFEGTNEILRLFIALSGFKEAGKYLKEVGEQAANLFNDPIKGFGVLSSYAAKKLAQLTSIGIDKISFASSPNLRQYAQLLEWHVVWFSRAVEAILRKHGTNVVGKQLISKRIANTAISLYVGLCVLSRLATRLSKDISNEERETLELIASIFFNQIKRDITQNLRKLDANEDKDISKLSDLIVSSGEYPFDLLDN